MGGVSVGGGGGGGKKSVDSEVNMVPFIDLLLSIISFLLMTAVWVQSGALQAQQPHNAPSEATNVPPVTTPDELKILIGPGALRVAFTAADMREINAGPRRLDELRSLLRERHHNNPQQREVLLQPEGAVDYVNIVEVMDVVYEVWGENRAAGQRVRDLVTLRFL